MTRFPVRTGPLAAPLFVPLLLLLLAGSGCEVPEWGAGQEDGRPVEDGVAALDEAAAAEARRADILGHRYSPATTGMDSALVAEAVERAVVRQDLS